MEKKFRAVYRKFAPGSIGISYEGNEIIEVVKHTEAYKQGVLPGWIILEVNSKTQPDDTATVYESIKDSAQYGMPTYIKFDTCGIELTVEDAELKSKTCDDYCRKHLKKKKYDKEWGSCGRRGCKFLHFTEKERDNFLKANYCWDYNSKKGCTDPTCERLHKTVNFRTLGLDQQCDVVSYPNFKQYRDKIKSERIAESKIPSKPLLVHKRIRRHVKKDQIKRQKLSQLGIKYNFGGYKACLPKERTRKDFDDVDGYLSKDMYVLSRTRKMSS